MKPIFVKQFIDLTTLKVDDTEERVVNLCENAIKNDVAAICVYPNFVSVAKDSLAKSNIKVASVAGCFPAAQSALKIKLAEVEYALECGADEIDIVFPVGLFFENKLDKVYEELNAYRGICKDKILKCILETGALQKDEHIKNASKIAIECGMDFLKTSTGKISPAATPDASKIMINAIKDHYLKTKKMVGFKVAGGVSTYEEATVYINLINNILDTNTNKKWLTPQYFRIGASRLLNNLNNL
ncbi:MAG: deoxyribose-phosphate aldolase [Bacteroidales bacterium]|jgi:deoxyribose-phosphate aldolase